MGFVICVVKNCITGKVQIKRKITHTKDMYVKYTSQNFNDSFQKSKICYFAKLNIKFRDNLRNQTSQVFNARLKY